MAKANLSYNRYHTSSISNKNNDYPNSTVVFLAREDRNKEQIELLKEVKELGLEVGSKGHFESVGWVKTQLRDIERRANELGIYDEIMKEYDEAKEIGKQNKGKLIGSSKETRSEEKPARPMKPMIAPEAIPQRTSMDEAVIERISVQQSIKAMVTMIKITQSTPELKGKLNDILAGVSDIHDKLAKVEAGKNPKATMENCMNMLIDVGWLKSYRIISFNFLAAEASIEIASELPESIVGSKEPVCQPICNILETIGGRCFFKSVKAHEKECIAMGRQACIFQIMPR